MAINIKDYKIQNDTKCTCGYAFTLKDITELEDIKEHGFYANIIKYGSHTQCPECHKKTVLLLEQKGQTWQIIDIATENNIEKQEEIKNKTEEQDEQKFICPECGKVCKSQIGLNAHIKTHK